MYKSRFLILPFLSIAILLGFFVFGQSLSQVLTPQFASAQSPSGVITPSFYPLVPCPTCADAGVSPVISGPAAPSITTSTQPTNGATDPEIENPCISSEASVAHKSKHWKHKGGISDFMEVLLRFFIELLNMLFKLFGGEIPVLNPSELTPSTGPENPAPSIEQPQPTTDPCETSPTDVPSTTVVPSASTIPSTNPSSSVLPSVPVGGQNPSLVLNLANWKLQLPIGNAESPTEIKQPQLDTYQIDPWFILQNGGIKFRAPVNGVTTSGSDYPRSELREMNGTANAAWSTATGTHTMTIEQAITAVPTTKKHVVAGQIHDSEDDVIVIRLEQPKLFIDIGGTDGPTLDANYTLGKRFNVKFEASNGQIKIYYNGATTPVYTMTKNISGAYFKAGAYTQSNCTTETAGPCSEDNYGEVVVYSVVVTHQ